jgi:hypothetical protein
VSEHDGLPPSAAERADSHAEESLREGPTEHLAAEPPPEVSVAQALPSAPGLRTLLAVVPVEAEGTPAWDAADARLGVTLVPYRDIAALLCPASAVGATGTEDVKARHWEVHRALLRGTVVPAPIGVTFASDGDVEKFLTEAYGTLKGALARVEGRWEFRLHVDLTEAGLSESLALDLVTHIYAELRRTAHAAIPFQRKGGRRLLSAAFLVDRTGSVAFQDRVEELGRVNGALAMDLTGPWPPYDFVQMHG